MTGVNRAEYALAGVDERTHTFTEQVRSWQLSLPQANMAAAIAATSECKHCAHTAHISFS